MRALTWAVDAWRTPLGKAISVILSVSLIFSCSNAFLASSKAYAADEGEQVEAVEVDASNAKVEGVGGDTNSGAPAEGTNAGAPVQDTKTEQPATNQPVLDQPAATQLGDAVESDAAAVFSQPDEKAAARAAADYEVNVGGTVIIGGTHASAHKWTSLDPSIAVVDGWSNVGAVTGIQLGTVVIMHEYSSGDMGWDTSVEYFKVTVSSEPVQPSKSTRVYVYIKIEGDTSGWQLNAHQYYTIGYFDAPMTELPIPAQGMTAPGFNYMKYLGNVVRFSGNAGMDLLWSAVDWTAPGFGMKTAYGATDYYEVPSNVWAWHLDGLLKVSSSYTVSYNVEGCDDASLSVYKNADIKSSSVSEVTGSKASAAPEGYRFVGWFKDDQLITDELDLGAELAQSKISCNTVNGTPKYIDTAFVARYAKEVSVSYDWGNAPEGAPALPEGANLAYGDEYTVDDTYYAPVSTFDDYGNKTGEWTFNGWDLSGTVVVDRALTIKGSWSFLSKDVETYVVRYAYEGQVPDGAPAVPEPQTYVVNQPVVIADAPVAPEGWEFEGWVLPDGIVAEDGGFVLAEVPEGAEVVLTGSWKPADPVGPPAPETPGPETPAPVDPAPVPAPTPAPAPGPGVALTDAGAPEALVVLIDDDATPLAAPQSVIADGAVPLAEQAEEAIEDDATPLSAFDEPHCWVHILMIIGIVLTAIYGVCVVLRRLGYAYEIEQTGKGATGSRRKASHVASDGKVTTTA